MMEGTTEPIIVVIGHPIAGNPSQFAVERALRSLKLDWRVLSFDVKPDDIAIALEGFSVTGIAGVMIDPSVASAASRWYADKTDGENAFIDCLYRDEQQGFVGSNEQQSWIDEQIQQRAGEKHIWIGGTLDAAALDREPFPADSTSIPPDPNAIAEADVIVITDHADGPVELEVVDWPENDGTTWVIDLTDGHPDQAKLRQLGYLVVTDLQRRIGTLQRSLRRWTGEDASSEVIHDAIEEYLGV